MKGFFGKLTSILLIIALFSSCATIGVDNRSEAANELRRIRAVSVVRLPVVNAIGPVFSIRAPSLYAGLMVAGQTGIELGYQYFVLLESGFAQHVSGSFVQGTGTVWTTTINTITIAFTNDELNMERFDVFVSSSFLDGRSFVTRSGRSTLWTLAGTTLVVGTAIMLSALAIDTPAWNDPNYQEAIRRQDRRLIGGGILLGTSWIFTIPMWSPLW